METQSSEEEVASRIIVLHDRFHMGFRKIAQTLSREGYKISKDKAWRLYKEYKALKAASVQGDRELGKLRDVRERAQNRLLLTKEKQEIRRSV